MSKNPHYVNNKDFYNAIVEYHEKAAEAEKKGLDKPIISDYIGECIYKIANKYGNKPCFMNYSFKDEMIGDGIENCILYFDRFDPNKTKNPFAYFTTIIHYAFLRRIQKEEKSRYTIYKNFQEMFIFDENIREMESHSDVSLTRKTYDNINDFMDRFEKKEQVKKEKAREKRKQGLQRFYEDEDNEKKSASSG